MITALVAESRAAGVIDRPVRVLNIMGHRAQESRERSNKPPFVHEPGRTCLCPDCHRARSQGCPPRGSVSNSRRHVDTWLPTQRVEHLENRVAVEEQRNAELAAFRVQAVSRLAAQYDEITRLRGALSSSSTVRGFVKPNEAAVVWPCNDGT
ncbi:hypothetical protein [Nocardia xishanensis]|uniref:hypothetical protein n=1 Tax=Nocardia xishanensis TaxID=238964 RepID=UPI000ABAAA3D|nr:hypothetical protein [Nocardia xishanensis]